MACAANFRPRTGAAGWEPHTSHHITVWGQALKKGVKELPGFSTVEKTAYLLPKLQLDLTVHDSNT